MTNASMKALRDASPRNHPDFDAFLERHEGLKAQITSTPPGFAQRSRPPARHRRLISLSAAVTAAAALAVFVGSLMLGGPSPQSAYAAAKKAIVATAAASSGTITGSLSHDGSSYRLETTRWNGDSISVTRGDMSQFGPNQALLLIDGGAYVEEANGTWLHFASASGVGPKVGPEVELAQNNVVGNPASQVLSLATGLTQTTQPDGTTLYTGTIPNSTTDAGVDPNDDSILRAVSVLSNGIQDDTPGVPGGFHNGLQLEMIVGADGFVRQVSLSYQQQDTGSPQTDGSYTWTISYSQLGSTPPITPPATSTPTPPVIWSSGPACTAPCGG